MPWMALDRQVRHHCCVFGDVCSISDTEVIESCEAVLLCTWCCMLSEKGCVYWVVMCVVMIVPGLLGLCIMHFRARQVRPDGCVPSSVCAHNGTAFCGVAVMHFSPCKA